MATTTTAATTRTSPNNQKKNINNHAVIVCSSRYWFNYRHAANALGVYQVLKANGIPDENIILMIADDFPTNARNPHKNGMYASGVEYPAKSWYDPSIEIDYRGEDVTVQSMVRALLGRQGEPLGTTSGASFSSRHQRPHLQTDENSNILIYLTGHGGDNFFKFQDIEEIDSHEIAAIFDELHLRQKYRQILLVADTCQAFTLGDHITAPNVMVVGSSLRDESSYAHHSDVALGLSVIERYTHAFLQYVQKLGKNIATSNVTIPQAMVDPYPFVLQRAHIGFRGDLMDATNTGFDANTTLLSDFFVNNQLQEPSSSSAQSLLVKVILPPTHIKPPTFLLAQNYPSSNIQEHSSPMKMMISRRLSLQEPRPSLWQSLLLHTESILPVVDDPSDTRFLTALGVLLLVLILSSLRRRS